MMRIERGYFTLSICICLLLAGRRVSFVAYSGIAYEPCKQGDDKDVKRDLAPPFITTVSPACDGMPAFTHIPQQTKLGTTRPK